ncbi:hypothetical protein KZ838_05560, partial [Pseudomonas aeruginosa]|uniref:hypothetical protein n=1 Tax=Pseudomonas aeruginosa TaxID=287 RepID=UPI001CA5E958
AEFGIRHRAAPYRKGQVLHSVFAAAELYARPADNLWLSVITVIVILTGIYIDYGPNGKHVGETLALMPGYMLDQLVPGFTDEINRVVRDTRGH